MSFKTRSPEILVELSWDSIDDIDLSVIEPNGILLSRFRQATKAGKWIGDRTSVFCENPFKFGRETIRYYPSRTRVKRGRYLAQVRHFNNCNKGPTRWKLRVSINGKVIKSKSGSSNRDSDEVIGDLAFKF